MQEIESKQPKSKPPIYKKWWFWLIVGFIALGIISGSGKDNAKKVGEVSSAQPTANDAQKVDEKEETAKADSENKNNNSESTEFKVGDVISFDGKEVSVLNVTRNYNAGKYRKPKSGNEFIKVTVKIENKSDSDISAACYDFEVQDSNGALENCSWFGEDDAFESTTLVPGGKRSGSLFFEVPKGDQNLKLVYKPSFSFPSKKVIIKL